MMFVKICGLTSERDIASTAKAGADAVGIMCVESSPRFVTYERAVELANFAKSKGVIPVLVTSGSSDIHYALHDGILSDAWLQLHGAETPDQVAECAKYTRVPVIKAISVASADDLISAAKFDEAHRILIDANPPAGADREGGHGVTFDWSILQGWTAPKPWILAGGLTPDNVSEAIAITGATAVDVSSGVESSPGVKDLAKIRDFIQAAKSASTNGAAA